MEAGSVIDPALRVIAGESKRTVVEAIDNPPVAVVAPADRLQPPDGFWIWRAFLGEPNRFGITLNLSSLESVDLSSTKVPAGNFVRTPDREKMNGEPGVATVQKSSRAAARPDGIRGSIAIAAKARDQRTDGDRPRECKIPHAHVSGKGNFGG
jgi:hypothetical protein